METKGSGRRDASKDFEPEDHQDRLSNLLDDILLLFLERLTTQEAARTSVLSRRWMHLFKQSSRVLLDFKDFYLKGDQDSKVSRDDLVKSNARLIQATESMLQFERFIRTLSLKFPMIEESIDIVRCVDKAMTTNRRIPSFQFLLYPEREKMKDWTQDFKINCGRLFMRFVGAGPRAFGGLSQLHIRGVELSTDDMTNVLNACNNLEHLYLHWCDYGYESAMEIEHPRLATLIIDHCTYQTVELKCLPRLTHVTCEVWVQTNAQYPISFGYVPQLSALILRNPTTIHHKTIQLSGFLSNYAMIRELDLKFQCLKVWIQPEAPKFLGTVLQNLQLLYLRGIREEYGLDWTIFFLEAAPFLKKIHVQVSDHPAWGQMKSDSQDGIRRMELLFQELCHISWQAPDDLKHYSLKELIISGYQVKTKFTEYIRRVVKAAVKLERVTLLDDDWCKQGDSCKYCVSPHRRTYPRTKRLSDMVKRQISKCASSPIEIKVGTCI